MMKVYAFRVTGISPLLMNNPASMRGGPDTVQLKKIPTPEEESAAKVYRTEEGQLYIPAFAFRSSLLGSCAKRKIGKLTANQAVSAGVFCAETQCLLIHPKNSKPVTDYKINVMRAVVQRQGVRRARPEIPEWATLVAFEVDDSFIAPEHILELMTIAGRMQGVGDYRPAKRGPFGRYTVEPHKWATKQKAA